MKKNYEKGTIYYKTSFSKAQAQEGRGLNSKGLDKSIELGTSKVLLKEPVGDGKTVYRFIGSKEVVDRDGDIVKISGMDLENYIKNPVVLWGHNHNSTPVGKTVGLIHDVENRELIFDIVFSSTVKGQEIETLVSEGILNATSIGFMVTDYDYSSEADAFELTETELFEISIVNVPANQEAVRVDTNMVEATAIKSLTQEDVRTIVAEAIAEALKPKTEEKEEVKQEENPDKKEEPTETDEAVKEEVESLTGEQASEPLAGHTDLIDYDRLAEAIALAIKPVEEESAQPDVGKPSEETTDEDHNATESPEETAEELHPVSVESLEPTDEIYVVVQPQEENN